MFYYYIYVKVNKIEYNVKFIFIIYNVEIMKESIYMFLSLFKLVNNKIKYLSSKYVNNYNNIKIVNFYEYL